MTGTLDLERMAAGQALLTPILARFLSVGFLLQLTAISAAGLLAYWVAPHLVSFFMQHINGPAVGCP